jgi:hypothetical protein
MGRAFCHWRQGRIGGDVLTGLDYGPFINRAQAKEQGISHYFTGKPCKNGHIAIRKVSSRHCQGCKNYMRECNDRWKANNYDLHRAAAKRYNQEKRNYSREYAVLVSNHKRALTHKLNSLMRSHLYERGLKKTDRSIKLLGAPLSVVCAHIEDQFQPGMSWENHGQWHYDHIRPCASFDLTDPEQQKQCFHYTNLQPLWAKDNLSKSDKWEAVAA